MEPEREVANKGAHRYFRYAGIATIIWTVLLLGYFASVPKLFIRMFPQEFGELLAGWFAPLAFIWASAAVVFQRRELLDATERLKQDGARAELEHSMERLGMAIQTLARTCERCELHKRGEDSVLLCDVIGKQQACADLAKGRHYDRLLLDVRAGLTQFVDNLESEGWVIGADEDAMEDLAADIGALHDLSVKIIGLLDAGAVSADAAPKIMFVSFLARVDQAAGCLRAIQLEYSSLGT